VIRQVVACGGLLALLVTGCAGAAPLLANPTPARPAPPSPSAAPTRPIDPLPIQLPQDDLPHSRLTEWWYYTGHLRGGSGERWGFEFVIFRAERGPIPVSWASHLALTDERGKTFRYDQRSEIGPQVDRSASAGGGFALAITGVAPPVGPGPTPARSTPPTPWQMSGVGGRDRLAATSEVAGFGLALDLAPARPVALHDRDGWVDFGPAGGSYYYSRTRLAASGTVATAGGTVAVEGLVWFDHQWGDFIAVGSGGWDWFAVNLDDGTDLTISLVRASDGSYPLVYGTVVDAAGRVRHLERDAFAVTPTGSWISPRTGARYPAGWGIEVPADQLTIDLRPTVADQELDTRQTTGVVYWEGSQLVEARRAGRMLGGEGYVELTGYVASP
jgi:predicted secreted hydrolase